MLSQLVARRLRSQVESLTEPPNPTKSKLTYLNFRSLAHVRQQLQGVSRRQKGGVAFFQLRNAEVVECHLTREHQRSLAGSLA